MEEEKKNWFLQWMEKPWIRTIAIILVISLLIGIGGHGLYLRKLNREYEKQEAARIEQERREAKRQAEFDDAYAVVRQDIEELNYAAAIEHLERCMELVEPGSAAETELLTTRASLNILLGNHEQAMEDLDLAAASDPDSPVILLLKSQTELGLQNYDQARSDMEKYLAVDPDNYDVRLSLAQLYETTGNYSLAADAYLALQKLRPGDRNIEMNGARCLILAQRLQEAEAILDPILAEAENESKGTAFFLRAMIRMQESDFKGASEDYTAAIEAGYDARICLEQITACAFVLGDHKSVLECGQKYHDIWPEGSTAASFYQQIGVSAMALKDYAHAEESLSRALELDPKYPGTQYYRGMAYFSSRQWQKAAEDFTQAIAMNYMTENALYNRGLCYTQLQDYQKAYDDLKISAECEDTEIAKSAQQLLPGLENALGLAPENQ